jgi:sulfite dehydrogenase
MRLWKRHPLPLVLLAAALTAPATHADPLAQGRLLFKQSAVPACALCHALKDAGAEGAIGPSLDDLKPDAARVAKALRNGIGQMPSYRDRLTEQQIETLSQYVARASGAQR